MNWKKPESFATGSPFPPSAAQLDREESAVSDPPARLGPCRRLRLRLRIFGCILGCVPRRVPCRVPRRVGHQIPLSRRTPSSAPRRTTRRETNRTTGGVEARPPGAWPHRAARAHPSNAPPSDARARPAASKGHGDARGDGRSPGGWGEVAVEAPGLDDIRRRLGQRQKPVSDRSPEALPPR